MSKAIAAWSAWSLIVSCLGACSDRSREPVAGVAQAAVGALEVGPELPVDDLVYTGNGQNWFSEGIAWNGSAYLLVGGSSSAAPGRGEALGWRLNASAQPLDPLPFALPFVGPLASNGSDYLMTSLNSAPIVRATRISAAGVVLDPTGLELTSTASDYTAVGQTPRAQIASNGSDYLVVWSDYRNGNNDIYGARVTGAGQVLDNGGFAISTGAGSQTLPVVAWDGARYVVAWRDTRSGGDEVYLARVTSAGPVLESSGLRIAPGRAPAIASDGVNSLVVWEQYRSGIYAARVSQAGTIVGSAPITILSSTTAQGPTLTWTGTSFVTYYHLQPCGDAAGTGGKRVSADGALLAAPVGGERCYAYGTTEALAADGAGRHVVADRLGPRGPDDFRVVTATAYASDGAALGSSTPSAANHQLHPQIAEDGNRYFIAWHDLRGTDIMSEVFTVYGARLGADGATLNKSAIVIDPAYRGFPYSDFISIASSGSHFFLASTRAGYANAYRIDNAGSVLNPAPVSLTTRAYLQGAWVYSHGTDYLAIWRQDVSTGIVGRRVSEQGTLLDQNDITFVPSPAIPGAAIWNGTNYFFVWSQSAVLLGAQVTPSGAMVGAPVPITSAALVPIADGADHRAFTAVSWDGSNHLVLWLVDQSDKRQLYGARVSTAGSVLDPGGFVIGSAPPGELNITARPVTWDGENHVVTWASGPGLKSAIHAARVSPGGTVLDAPPLVVSPLGEDPVVASIRNGRALLAYSRYDGSMKYRATRVWVRTLGGRCECDGGSCEAGVCPEADAGPAADSAPGDSGDALEVDAAANDGAAGSGGTAGASGIDSGAVASGGTAGTGADAGRAGGSDAATSGSGPSAEDGCSCRVVPLKSSFGGNAILGMIGLLAAARRGGGRKIRNGKTFLKNSHPARRYRWMGCRAHRFPRRDWLRLLGRRPRSVVSPRTRPAKERP